MVRHKIPTAAFETFSDPAPAHAYIERHGAPIVVKADGLAAGKGVIVAMTAEQAHQAIDDMLVGNQMGDAGSRVVIEEFLTGEEASFIAMVDGKNVLALASSQDHKRLLDGDQGPNTGGMGAYSPAPVVTQAIHEQIMKQVIEPTVSGMAADGIPFHGFLYAGIMVSENGTIKTLEFNCRMGDPETQPIMMRLQSDFSEALEHAIDGTLNSVALQWDPRCAMGVVLAAPGYPSAPTTGSPISGLPANNNNLAADCVVFHAGTQTHSDNPAQTPLTSGGRVMCVTALGETVQRARELAYEGTQKIHFDGVQLRSDIGYRAIARKRSQT